MLLRLPGMLQVNKRPELLRSHFLQFPRGFNNPLTRPTAVFPLDVLHCNHSFTSAPFRSQNESAVEPKEHYLNSVTEAAVTFKNKMQQCPQLKLSETPTAGGVGGVLG